MVIRFYRFRSQAIQIRREIVRAWGDPKTTSKEELLLCHLAELGRKTYEGELIGLLSLLFINWCFLLVVYRELAQVEGSRCWW
jgi:hypothetical protein